VLADWALETAIDAGCAGNIRYSIAKKLVHLHTLKGVATYPIRLAAWRPPIYPTPRLGNFHTCVCIIGKKFRVKQTNQGRASLECTQ
jgi:hypothetical protein